MTSTRIGIEVDGDRVTVVEVLDDVAVATRSIDVGDLDESVTLALAGFKQGRQDPPMRVSLCTSRMTLRRIDVSASMRQRSVFEDAAFTAMPVDRASHTAAGLFFRPDLLASDVLSPGVALVAPLSEVTKAYEVFSRRRVEIVAPSLTFRAVDGLWLALRYSSSEVTLVQDDHVVATRQLRVGGLNAVAAGLGEPELQDAVDRLNRALESPGNDVIADAEVDRFLRTVAAEVRQTADYWVRGGEQTGTDIVVFGPGALPGKLVTSALKEQDFTSVWPDDFSRRLSYITPSERPAALGAYFAALTIGEDLPQAVYVNPFRAVEASVRRKRSSRFKVALVVVGLVAIVAASTGYPTYMEYKTLSEARSSLDAAQTAYSQRAQVSEQLASLESRATIYHDATLKDPQWSRVVSLIIQTAPKGATVTQANSSIDGEYVVVSLSADLPKGTYADLTNWLGILTKAGAQTWSPNFTYKDQKASYQVTFRLPVQEWSAPRVLPVIPGVTEMFEGIPVMPTAVQESLPPVVSAEPSVEPSSEPAPEPSLAPEPTPEPVVSSVAPEPTRAPGSPAASSKPAPSPKASPSGSPS